MKLLQENLPPPPPQLDTVDNLHLEFLMCRAGPKDTQLSKQMPVLLTAVVHHAPAIFQLFAKIQFWCR